MRWTQTIQLLGTNFLIILFTYAGVTKLLEKELFYLNLLNSPVLTVEKQWIVLLSWIIPFMELFTVFLLVFARTKLKGVYLSIVLLSTYLLYILLLFFRAPYRPCSCGGIIDLLSWEQQLWFTLSCLGFAGGLLYLKKSELKRNPKELKNDALYASKI